MKRDMSLTQPAAVFRYAGGEGWLCFGQPRQVIAASTIDGVMPALAKIEETVERDKLHAAGFLAYEAAPAFDPALKTRAPYPGLPLVWFGLFEEPTLVEMLPFAKTPSADTLSWEPSLAEMDYAAAIDAIKAAIARGDTYQVNYTYRLRAHFADDARGLFAQLAQAQETPYLAYLDTGRFAICSASPELFFRLDGAALLARPMKGTMARGLTCAQDRDQCEKLQVSVKNRAENAMIVDMVRNDLGRVATVGSVAVTRPFAVEKYPTLWQMVSDVTARSLSRITEILAALFPCASITGAPKAKTMGLIAELETGPRGVYTGAVGLIAPGRQAGFSVAIRTVTVDRESSEALYGVGGGVVWDSTARDEYAESLLKARVLGERQLPFRLLETLLWTPAEGYFLLDRHVARLCASADYFDFPVDAGRIRGALHSRSESFAPKPHKVRLLVDVKGGIEVETSVLPLSFQRPVRLRICPLRIDSRDAFLYHKTTKREVYARARAACPDADDVLLVNERGEVTETTIANVVVRRNGQLLTPAVDCGLLAGTFRDHLIERGEIRESVLMREDLHASERVYVVNSVRQWRRAVVEGSPRGNDSP